MPIEPHARDPDDEDRERPLGDEWPQGDHNDDDGIELTAHEAAFKPPGSDSAPLAPSHLHSVLRLGPSHFAPDELAVLGQVRTVSNADGAEVLAPEFLGQVLGACFTVLQIGQDLAGKAAWREVRAKKDEQRRKELASDLFQEAVLRWLDGSWNYSKAYFDEDMASSTPARCVALRLFGVQGRIRGLLWGEYKRSKTRAATEEEFFKTYYGALTPPTGPKDDEPPDMPAPESVTRADVYRLLHTPQVMARIPELVEITAEREGFGQHSGSAAEVFRLLRGKERLTHEQIAERCKVPRSFVSQMSMSGEGCYVVRQIQRFASDTEAYCELMGLCPDELYEHFRGHSIEWLVLYLRKTLGEKGLFSPDASDEDASDD